jgi:hypothetical protein
LLKEYDSNHIELMVKYDEQHMVSNVIFDGMPPSYCSSDQAGIGERPTLMLEPDRDNLLGDGGRLWLRLRLLALVVHRMMSVMMPPENAYALAQRT